MLHSVTDYIIIVLNNNFLEIQSSSETIKVKWLSLMRDAVIYTTGNKWKLQTVSFTMDDVSIKV